MSGRQRTWRFGWVSCGLAAVIAVPGWLTWNRLRQLQRDNTLVEAVVQNDTPAALELLAQGANPNTRQSAQQTPPTLLQTFRLLLRLEKPPVQNGLPVLLLAAQQGNDTMMRALATKGANVNVADDEGGTPLMWAISKHDDKATVQNLLEKGANVNAPKIDGKTALMCAAYRGDSSLLSALLARGASINATMEDGGTALLFTSGSEYSAYKSGSRRTLPNKQCIRLLLDRGANVNAKWETGRTALIDAAANDDLATAQLLLARGANVNARDGADSDDATALLWALENCDHAMVHLLMNHGADPQDGARFQSCLQAAIRHGDEEMVKLLLAHGVPTNAESAYSTTFWDAGALKGVERYRMMRLLLAHGADINDLYAKEGTTTLICAAGDGDLPLMRFLLSPGADREVENHRGKTALLVAAEEGHTQAVKLLLTYGANLKHEDEQGHNATDLAYHNGHIETARYLYRRGLRATNRFFDGNG